MDLTSFVDEGLGNSAYLVAIGDGRAIAIDPPRDVAAMRAAADDRGLAIVFAFETHLHADFISGSRELAALGATVVGARAARLEFPHRPLDDGDTLDLGGLDVEAIATPGHTPEHLAYLIRDGRQPLALFSGGALLPGSVARTDLIAPDRTEPLARALYRALHDRILMLPDALRVYPTHGGGSFCSIAASGDRTTTIGAERAANPLLLAADEDSFVARLFESFGSYPAYFMRLREVNRAGPPVYGGLPDLGSLALDEFDRMRAQGAEVIDVRSLESFGRAHIPGSLSIALRSSFASWLGWLVPADRQLAFVLDDSQDRRELVRQALGIGFERLVGELQGGLETWTAAGRPTEAIDLVEAPVAGDPIVDVRQASEFRAGHIPGARPIELGSVESRLADVPDGATFMCGHGERAMTAASLVQRRGRSAKVLVGSASDWALGTNHALAYGDEAERVGSIG